MGLHVRVFFSTSGPESGVHCSPQPSSVCCQQELATLEEKSEVGSDDGQRQKAQLLCAATIKASEGAHLADGRARREGWRNLEGVEHVAGEQGKDGHNQDCFQLLVVRGSAAEVIACRLLGVILDGQPLAYTVRSDVLRLPGGKIRRDSPVPGRQPDR